MAGRPLPAQPAHAPHRAWRCAVLLVTLLAFWWQSQVTQTHLHFHAHPHPVALAAADGASQTLGRSTAELAADCLLCGELAHAGHYLTPALIGVVVQHTAAPLPGAAIALAPAISQPSHAWQSRAPPILQA